MKGVCILTEKKYLHPVNPDWYIKNILQEEQLIQDSLQGLGIVSCREAWDVSFDVSKYKYLLFRTTWNYFDKIKDFKFFLTKNRSLINFINPYSQIIWNLNKKYLLELSEKGINIPETTIITKSSFESLSSVSARKKWSEFIIKPCVSAAAWNTFRIKRKDTKKFEKKFINLVNKNDMILQLFQKNIILKGEISLMMIGGEYSHAVIKNVKRGDFRVQDDFGGKVSAYIPSVEEIGFAERVIMSCGFSPVYARVDIIWDNNGVLALSELELIEPEMWFRFYKPAANKLAEAISLHIEKN